ncbi:MAG TPA: hypothetical protein VJT81_07995 [Burkholderiales bacterium]|nr:hypothetical protein [Burkholderiales bacterium]
MKLIKIRFTSWRDRSVPPRTIEFQAQLDALTMREGALIAASARARAEQEHDGQLLQRSLARVNDDLQTIDAQRTFLLSAEEAAAEAETRASTEHPKVGTFGYQVLDETGSRVAMVVDEAGNHLPARALYTFEIVDENPPLPAWAKKGPFM